MNVVIARPARSAAWADEPLRGTAGYGEGGYTQGRDGAMMIGIEADPGAATAVPVGSAV